MLPLAFFKPYHLLSFSMHSFLETSNEKTQVFKKNSKIAKIDHKHNIGGMMYIACILFPKSLQYVHIKCCNIGNSPHPTALSPIKIISSLGLKCTIFGQVESCFS